MRVDKVILKSVLSTLAAIVVLCAVMFATLILAFPSTMMGLTYDLGMDDASAWFADRAYKQHDNIYFISYATSVAIGMGDDEAIVSYGEAFIADEEFASYCAEADKETHIEGITGTYAQYIYGQVYAAEYRRGAEDPITKAFAVNADGFPPNNAVTAVLFAALKKQDRDSVAAILYAMLAKKETSVLSEEDAAYLDGLITSTQKWMDGIS